VYLVQGTGDAAALQIIIFRLIQAVGGAFLMGIRSNFDRRPFHRNNAAWRWASIKLRRCGPICGPDFGRYLAAINWRAVFLISVPFSVGGTIWAYVALRETATIRQHQKLDIPGNVLFAVGLNRVADCDDVWP